MKQKQFEENEESRITTTYFSAPFVHCNFMKQTEGKLSFRQIGRNQFQVSIMVTLSPAY